MVTVGGGSKLVCTFAESTRPCEVRGWTYILAHDGVEITILDGPYLQDGRPTERAVGDYTALVARLDELKGFAADQLLTLYHEDWRDDEIGEVDRAGFTGRLDHPAIHLYDELGVANVYFSDGDLFAGHRIEVHVNAGKPIYAGIIG